MNSIDINNILPEVIRVTVKLPYNIYFESTEKITLISHNFQATFNQARIPDIIAHEPFNIKLAPPFNIYFKNEEEIDINTNGIVYTFVKGLMKSITFQ